MILSSAPANEAVLSNVGSVSEFTIKATSKSFQILSSGLYANKVKAIIRELACNALDSHVANGNPDIPFVVHLPNSMEPYFSVRDFGTGLSHDQVINIFTTFFESTKTGSNDFIGALGLGSKSPFSYTDNFTVTAIKDGKKGIHTAFINEQGVPSIALMMSEDTDEHSGVEVKFSVNDRYDFSKFREEAQQVFKFWKNRPTMTGDSGFKFLDPVFKDRDIVPGVHSIDDPYCSTSIAIMGNIAYPINIPDAEASLANLRSLLNCGLVMEFGIGELDFQASREGLSYVPLTIESIKIKLETLNTQLAIHLAAEADKIENLWERLDYLHGRMDNALWTAAVTKYVAVTKFPLLDLTTNRWSFIKRFDLAVSELATEYNISIKGFVKPRGTTGCRALKTDLVRLVVGGQSVHQWQIRADMDKFFVFNDTKVGALERAKHHWRQKTDALYTESVYVMDPVDRTKPMKKAEFLAAIMNPPSDRVSAASSLRSKERAAGMGQNVSILRLESRSRSRRHNDNVAWTDAGKVDTFDTATTHYYIPLSGFKSLGKVDDIKVLREYLSKSGLYTGTIYGVRKGDIEAVKSMTNWVPLDTLVESKLAALGNEHVMGIVKQAIGFDAAFHWQFNGRVPATSPYMVFAAIFRGVREADGVKTSNLQALCRLYKVATTTTAEPTAMIADYQARKNAVLSRYPLLAAVSRYSAETVAIADYINMVDQVKAEVIQNS